MKDYNLLKNLLWAVKKYNLKSYEIDCETLIKSNLSDIGWQRPSFINNENHQGTRIERRTPKLLTVGIEGIPGREW